MRIISWSRLKTFTELPFEGNQAKQCFQRSLEGRVDDMSSGKFATVMLQFVPASFVVGAGMELFMLNTVSASTLACTVCSPLFLRVPHQFTRQQKSTAGSKQHTRKRHSIRTAAREMNAPNSAL